MFDFVITDCCLYNLYKVIYATTNIDNIGREWKNNLKWKWKHFFLCSTWSQKVAGTSKISSLKKSVSGKIYENSPHFMKFGWVTKELQNKTCQLGLNK